MKRILALTLSLLMVFAVMPMALASAEETYSYKTIIDASEYNGATLKQYASPWYTAGLTRAYNTTYVGYDSTLDVMELKRGQYDPAGLYYFDSTLGATAANSLGFRVWMKGGTDADTTSNKNLYFIFDTIDGETHTAYAAAWYTNSSYGVTVPAEGGWVEFLWADMDKNFRVNTNNAFVPNAQGKGGNRPTLSVGSGATVKSDNWLSKMDGFAIGIGTVTTNAIYYIGDVQFIMPASAEEPASPVTTAEAASIRLGAVNGIRFYTSFDKDAIDALNVNGEVVEYGTIIAPADVIDGEFTHEDDNVDVKYTATEYWAGDEFVGSIVNIKEANIGRNFVARGYVKIGETYYYSDTTSTRSLKGVATALQNDANNTALYEANKDLVDGWAAAADYVG